MTTARPTAVLLQERLCEALEQPVEIVDRDPNLYATTFPSEIVTCRTAKGGLIDIFCKYVLPEICDADPWHTYRSCSYEAEVYEHVVEPCALTTPRFFGVWAGPSGETWLFMEHIEGVPLKKDPEIESLVVEAARWLGTFHRVHELQHAQPRLRFLQRWQADYFRDLLLVAREHDPAVWRENPWLSRLSENFDAVIETVSRDPATVIHGEFYPKNVLVRGGRLYPIDWQTAAVSHGVVDLAMLTAAWPQNVAHRCEEAYSQARYGHAPSAEWRQQLMAARLCTYLHWVSKGEPWLEAIGYVQAATADFDRLMGHAL